MKSTAKFLLIFLLMFFAISIIFSREASAEKKIGILVWSDEPRYIESKNAIIEQLKKDKFAEPNVKFTVEVAGGNKAKAAQIAQKLEASKPDMVIAVGTSAAVAAANAIKDIPVVFSMVYDPVDSKIAKSWESSGNNTTGASPKVPMHLIMENLKKFVSIKSLAVLYTPGEKNSESQLKEILALQGDSHIKIIPVPLSNKNEVSSIVSDVSGKAEAVFLTGSNIVGESLDTIISITTKAKVVTATHLEDIVERGALLGVCANPGAVGRLAGEKASKVLKGAKPSSVPIEALKKFDVIINMKAVKAGQINVPSTLSKSASRVIQ